MPEREKINPWWQAEESDHPAETHRLERTTREIPARRTGDYPPEKSPIPETREGDGEG